MVKIDIENTRKAGGRMEEVKTIILKDVLPFVDPVARSHARRVLKDAEEMFTLSFFKEDYRKVLNLCGSKSGRDCDKDKEAGLTPYYTDGTTAYEEADLIFVCRKLYAQEMKPECFTVDGPDEKWYPGKDYHTMYMGEIVKVLVRE